MKNGTFAKFKKNSAVIMVKRHDMQIGGEPLYVNKDACEGMKPGDIVELPDEGIFKPMSGKDGNWTTKDGKHVLQTLGF